MSINDFSAGSGLAWNDWFLNFLNQVEGFMQDNANSVQSTTLDEITILSQTDWANVSPGVEGKVYFVYADE